MDRTNKVFLNEDDIFAMEGRTNGFSPSDGQLAAARAMAKTLNLGIYKQMQESMNPTNIASAGVLTNEVTKEEYPVAKDEMGRILNFIKPEVINTDAGFQYITGPGRTRNLINQDTGAQPKGYAAMSGGWMGGQQPTVGMNNDAARAAATAQQGQAPAPAPAAAADAPPPLSMTNSAGAAMTFSSPYQVREAFMKNQINHDEAKSALLHWGMK